MTSKPLDEFGLIARHLAPLATYPGARGLTDDVAVLAAADAKAGLVLNTDTVVCGVHFLPDDPPAAIAERVLRVNLSDLAAKGARPIGYLLSLALSPAEDGDWVAGFCDGLRQNQQAFAWSLLGGDTVRTPGAFTATVTALGEALPGGGPLRSAAQAGDDIWVTGTIGDGALGLAVCQGKAPAISQDLARQAEQRFRMPEPRVALGRALCGTGLIRASADVSDGLVADTGHIAEASGLCAVIEGAAVPLSPAASAAVAMDGGWFSRLITGGDDYELLLTAPPSALKMLTAAASERGVPLTRVGHMEAGSGIKVLDQSGVPFALSQGGYRHF